MAISKRCKSGSPDVGAFGGIKKPMGRYTWAAGFKPSREAGRGAGGFKAARTAKTT